MTGPVDLDAARRLASHYDAARRLARHYEQGSPGYSVTAVTLRALVAEVERLRKENEKLRAIIERALDCNDGGDAMHQILLDADALGGEG